ncbi:alpha/beta hydrolase [Dokdonia sinensis]|uniref:Alpha/beta hydrolase n=1 Tax=Dokdonia sinensis TaxID=2479847 RepID=A0A3M0GGE3_9FLAO|nr:alpha/beta fold hydrolase [Dokdonia sinensis]RMB64171.1 alpha/beta hydrolase [Dokdonia sinensis]
MKQHLLAITAFLLGLSAYSQEITGDWNAMLKVMGQELPLVLHISEQNGTYKTTLDSPKQGAMGIEASATTFINDTLNVEVKAIGMTYEGVYQENGNVVGTFQQGGMQLPLELTREAIISEPVNRPQEPIKPYPYKEEEVTFENTEAGITLAGTLTIPKSIMASKAYPAVILISGSGPQNRDEELLGHKPFLVLSDYLTRQGFAVLRYDDRGTAQSTGDFASATSEDLATDAQAAFEFLLSRKQINPNKIGFAGHSEGGLIAPMVAAKNKDVAFIALLAGVGQPGAELLADQRYLIGKAQGMSEETLKKNRIGAENIYKIINDNTGDDEVIIEKATIYLKNALTQNPELVPQGMSVDQLIEQQLNQLTTPWFQYFLKTDPSPTLEKVQCPVLAINGSLDLQVPSQKNLSLIEEHVKKGGNDDVTTVEIPNLNHLFQTAETGSPTEYGAIEETFSPVALEIIGNWIKEKTN